MVVAVQVAGQPGNQRAGDEHLQTAADISADDRATGEQRTQRILAACFGALACALIASAKTRLLDYQWVDDGERHAKNRHDDESGAPAQVLGDDATQCHAQY
ncbi:hypothetical protein D3C84_1116740 [compost metagenome]